MLGGGALAIVVAGLALGIALLAQRDPRVVSTPEPPADGRRPAAPPPEPAIDEPARRVEAPPEPELEPPAAVAPSPEPVAPVVTEPAGGPPKEWPPPRAFTERCKAPGGGCVAQCRPLAGGRCLDPCFIHTDECSKDCVQLDGTCGWPPPDVE